MSSVLLIFALLLAGVAAVPRPEHDIKINVYDATRSLHMGIRLKAVLETIKRHGQIHFREDMFHDYTDQVKEFILALKDKGEKNALRGYLIREHKTAGTEERKELEHIIENVKDERFYAFTPLAAKYILPSFFNTPMKEVYHSFYPEKDLDRSFALVFLIPRKEIDESRLKNLLLIAEFDIYKDGSHSLKELVPTFKSEDPNDKSDDRFSRMLHREKTIEAYGEPTIAKTEPVVVRYFSPEGFRLLHTSQYELPGLVTSAGLSVDPFERRFSEESGLTFEDAGRINWRRLRSLPSPEGVAKKIVPYLHPDKDENSSPLLAH